MSNVLAALQGDFKVFLQALWSQLDLPEPTRAQYAIADYLQHGPKRLQIQAFRGVGQVGSGAVEYGARTIASPYTTMYGAATGYGTYQDPNKTGYGIHAQPKTTPGQPAAPAATPAQNQPGGINISYQPTPMFDQMQHSGSYTPFAALEKSAAGGLAGGAQKLLQWGSQRLGRSASKAKATAGSRARQARMDELGNMKLRPTAQERQRLALAEGNLAARNAMDAAGNWRVAAGRRLGAARRGIENSPLAQKAINYGGLGTGLVGANLLGRGAGHRRGHAAGMEEGAAAGFDLGRDLGIETALSQIPQDPGILGRILNVFRGQSAGPGSDAIRALLAGDMRDQALDLILSGEYKKNQAA